MLDIGPALSISGYRENIRRFASTGKKILRIYLHVSSILLHIKFNFWKYDKKNYVNIKFAQWSKKPFKWISKRHTVCGSKRALLCFRSLHIWIL